MALLDPPVKRLAPVWVRAFVVSAWKSLGKRFRLFHGVEEFPGSAAGRASGGGVMPARGRPLPAKSPAKCGYGAGFRNPACHNWKKSAAGRPACRTRLAPKPF